VLDRPLALWQELQSMIGGPDTLSGFQMPKFDWMQPTVEFLSPTFTEFLLFTATLILFIASWRDLRRALILTFADRDARLRTLRILNEIEVHLGNYLLTVTMINTGVGIATGIACAIAHMPNAPGLGALAATLNFIPIIGPVAMFVVLLGVGIVALPTLSAGLVAPLAFVAIAFVEGHFVTPTIIGRRLALNALAVFIALAFWTWLWGPMGAFLSSPLLIVALILKEHLMPVNSPQLPAD
jgi:predicted PurR-regulated permease PerM